MKVNPKTAREVKERLLAMFTYDCGSFLQFRALLEQEHSEEVGNRLDSFFDNLNQLLELCGAPTND